MSDADSECLSDVDNFPSLHCLVKICLNMKPDTIVESPHFGNGRSIAKIIMSLSKALDKKSPALVFLPGRTERKIRLMIL